MKILLGITLLLVIFWCFIILPYNRTEASLKFNYFFDQLPPTNNEKFLNVLQIKDDHRIPNIWPTEGKISSLFGMRFHPIKKVYKRHSGVDIANLKNTDIVATADGVVKVSSPHEGYGNLIIIDHKNGFETYYGHAEMLLVGSGSPIKKGQVIAKMGKTGLATGDHLHYEIRFAGEPLDPVVFVK